VLGLASARYLSVVAHGTAHHIRLTSYSVHIRFPSSFDHIHFPFSGSMTASAMEADAEAAQAVVVAGNAGSYASFAPARNDREAWQSGSIIDLTSTGNPDDQATGSGSDGNMPDDDNE
jgi:hypothetical protein